MSIIKASAAPMSEKDPSSWQMVFMLFSPELKAALFAVGMAFLRILYENKDGKWLRKILEALMCGGLTYTAASLLSWFEVQPGVAIGMGGVIGMFGADYTREKAKRIFEKRIAADDITTKQP